MKFPARPVPGFGVWMVLLVAVLTYQLTLPVGWSADAPLPWDEAGHLQGALDVTRGLTGPDGGALRRAVLGADQYPPMHSIVLGTWMALFGTGVGSWMAFGLMVYLLTAALLASLHPVAGLYFVGLGMFGGLAPSLMVEPLAVLWVVLALRLLPDAFDTREDRLRFAGAWIAVLLAVLTKYNFGLPLVVGLGIGCAMTGNRRAILASVGAGALVVAAWALYLSVQDQGWEMFRSFARNRSNSAGMSPFGRVDWYFDSFRQWWTGAAWSSAGFAAAVAVACGTGLRRAGPRTVASLALALLSFGAFAFHPYLLGRNLVVVVVALCVVLGAGWASIGWGRNRWMLHAGVIGLALAAVFPATGPRKQLVVGYFPGDASLLEPVSAQVASELEGGGFVRVVGTFNAFSAGWVRLLQTERAPATTLTVDAPYPLDRARDGLSWGWDPAYLQIVESWLQDGTRKVIGLEVEPDSPFHGEDYERWGRWRLNLIRALRESPGFQGSATRYPEAGVTVWEFEPTR